METAKFTPISKTDLKEIKDFMAQVCLKPVSRYMGILKQKCNVPVSPPGLGVSREEYCGLYKFPIENFLIFYRP